MEELLWTPQCVQYKIPQFQNVSWKLIALIIKVKVCSNSPLVCHTNEEATLHLIVRALQICMNREGGGMRRGRGQGSMACFKNDGRLENVTFGLGFQ